LTDLWENIRKSERKQI